MNFALWARYAVESEAQTTFEEPRARRARAPGRASLFAAGSPHRRAMRGRVWRGRVDIAAILLQRLFSSVDPCGGGSDPPLGTKLKSN